MAENAATAGALATAFCVLAPADSERLASQLPGVDFLLVARRRTPDRKRDLADARSAARATARRAQSRRARLRAPSRPGTRRIELTVAIDLDAARRHGEAALTSPSGSRTRTSFPCARWRSGSTKPRYLPELQAWYRDDRLRAMAEGTDIVESVARARRAPPATTRSPGTARISRASS